jgi:hypothetical protein
MRSKRGMLKPSWSAPALFMALTIAGSPEASARVDPVFPDLQVCTRIFPSACATLVRMEVINANTLEFEVFNSTIITGPGDPLEDSFIGKIIFNFQGAPGLGFQAAGEERPKRRDWRRRDVCLPIDLERGW